MSTACVPPRGSIRMETLHSVLAPIHDRWIERIAPVLLPGTETPADLWEHWAEANCLGGHFESWFRFECALAESLVSILEPTAAAALASARSDLEETRHELMAVAWQCGTEKEVAALSRRLLAQTQRWCVALEFATVGLRLAELTEAGRALLDQIDAAATT